MTLREKILVLENRIIDWLTILTWWIEVRFGKTNVDVALEFHRYGNFLILLAIVVGFVTALQKGLFVFVVIFFFATLGYLFVVALDIFDPNVKDEITEDFPQGCPNPSRMSIEASNKRLIGVAWSFLIFTLSLFSVPQVFFLFFLMIALLAITAEYFLLSCDSIPPEEKAKRRARNEIENLVTQSSGA